jgi:PRTRC genetic system ThiF family protein
MRGERQAAYAQLDVYWCEYREAEWAVGEGLEALNAAMPRLGATVLQVLREQSRHVYPLFTDLLISCVDSRSARGALHRIAWRDTSRYRYWLDLGNTEATAQVVLGQPEGGRALDPRATGPRLPCVTELFPELLDDTAPEDNQPSCSVRMSLASQGLFVNDVAVRFAAQLLYELFSRGRLVQHGVVVNLDSKRAGPIEVDPRTWARFGFFHAGSESNQSESRTLTEAEAE